MIHKITVDWAMGSGVRSLLGMCLKGRFTTLFCNKIS
jgi:hypothetical protein